MDRKETFVRVVGLAAGLAGLVGSVRYGMQNKHPYAGVAVGVLVVAPVASALGAGLAAFVVGASPSAMLPMRAAAVPAIGPNGINLPTEGIRLPPEDGVRMPRTYENGSERFPIRTLGNN